MNLKTQEMVDTLGVLKLISQSERSIELGEVTPHAEVMAALRRRLDTRPAGTQ